MKRRKWVSMRSWSMMIVLLALLVTACGGQQGQPAQQGSAGGGSVAPSPPDQPDSGTGPRFGGELHVASDESPPTLDAHKSNVTATTVVALHLYEGLFALDSRNQPQPMLAAGADISDDGLTYTIHLRQGVKFHNGDEMTSADVVASLQRWGEVAGPGQAFFKNVESLTADGEYAVILKLAQPSGAVLTTLATPNQMAAIYPKAVVEAADPQDGIQSFIGTGPYEFVEHIPDQYVRVRRYDGYQPVGKPADGLSGDKVAYADEIYFHKVTDPNIRVAGVETGQYQFADFIPTDEYVRLVDHATVDTVVTPPRGWNADVFNMEKGIMTNVKLRQAWQAAVDPLEAAMGHHHPDFFRLDPSIMLKEMAYHSTAGEQLYNQADVDKAKQLLAEAGYDGTPIRWMVSTGRRNFALVVQQQLEAVGFNLDLEIMEWATLVQRRANTELWDVFSTEYTMRPEPTDMAFLACANPPKWCDPAVAELVQQIRTESDFAKRYAMWEKVQEAFYEQVPIVKYNDYANLRLKEKRVRGYANDSIPFFWNVWLEP